MALALVRLDQDEPEQPTFLHVFIVRAQYAEALHHYYIQVFAVQDNDDAMLRHNY